MLSPSPKLGSSLTTRQPSEGTDISPKDWTANQFALPEYGTLQLWAEGKLQSTKTTSMYYEQIPLIKRDGELRRMPKQKNKLKTNHLKTQIGTEFLKQ